MNYTAYQITRHFFCMSLAFLPRRIATPLLDCFAVFAPGCEITFTDSNGNEVTL